MSYTFMGYPRANGKYGARNLVAVIPSVICANDVGQAICRQVQGTIGYFHHQGCCQLPIDLKRVTDTLSNLGQSPNVGAALVVSLGCEGTDHERLVEEIRATGKPVEIIRIQELGGTSRAIQAGIDAAQRLVQQISGIQRVPVDVSNVVMAIKCGASDTTSGMASNCVIGYVADKLVDLGATVVFGETTEFLGGEHILARRAVGGEKGPVGQKIYEIVDSVKAELDGDGVPYKVPEQGIMIETPAAVMIGDELAELVDFFSIGTNDLTQYTLAIDRQNEKLDEFYNAHHKAILRMIRMTVENAHKAGKWAGICGELGADPELTREFVRMGVDELSVAPSMVLRLRKAVREMKTED